MFDLVIGQSNLALFLTVATIKAVNTPTFVLLVNTCKIYELFARKNGLFNAPEKRNYLQTKQWRIVLLA